MTTIEPYELATFRRFRLDPDKVLAHRKRLSGEPPIPLNELRAQQKRLDSLVKKVNFIKEQIESIKNQLSEQSIEWPWSDELWSGYGGDAPYTVSCMSWDLEQQRWGPGYSHGDRFTPIYTKRPEKEDALRAWNLFLVAFRKEPKFIARRPGYRAYHRGKRETYPAHYFAEYLDWEGQPVSIAAFEIRQSRTTVPASEPVCLVKEVAF